MDDILSGYRGWQYPTPAHFRFRLGDKVRKVRGSSWRGTVCGWYSTDHTPEGYCVASLYEPGNVQVYPAKALEEWNDA